ncbi:GspE/PulE family protein [Halarsenatibacter silvermanii]|uniref:General secretion pathway protein E n=1 Tax=Halarsenatibacter silvermanii TaxID=321763 RepID=A0A1G9K149_9FIRM|nr:GspE/PulE family protein [Halarsenatibacter silvermanii]SDL43045.1 general secretion pathway protein E [Halarsenatibacter silvermanii]
MNSLSIAGSQVTVEKLLQSLIKRCIDFDISDIHFEPLDGRGRIRFRRDGLLETVSTLTDDKLQNLISRLKVLSGLDITESRKVQEGVLRWQPSWDRQRDCEFRVSIIPTVRGEKAVLRRLIGEEKLMRLTELGFRKENELLLEKMISSNQGIIFVCGPTGSGKTTTLFACLDRIRREEINIITLEDPVEIYLEGVSQIQVNSEEGGSFAEKLRAGLRQDPDIIMVGEIRDIETARMAVRAALTGHLVLTTIHTFDALGTIIRLREMGIPSYLTAETLLGIVSQRLLRKTCEKCEGEGCEVCFESGFRGRTAIQEVIYIDRIYRQAIMNSHDRKKLENIRENKETCTLLEDGCQKAEAGLVEIEEVERVLR